MLPGNQANIEYFFRLVYEWVYGQNAVFDYVKLKALFAHIWTWVTVIGYAISFIGFIFIIYLLNRLFKLRKKEQDYYSTLIASPDEAVEKMSPRWLHIQSLVDGANASQWREAIIEADIMLEDILAQNGYIGAGVGEKLKAIAHNKLATINDAWEAHKVRNQIAHQGSAFILSAELANRTISRYESVFRELKAI